MDPNDDDPMVQLFGEGVDQFVLYEKTRDENYKSRSERHRAKLDRLHKDLADPQLRKIRNKQRRDAEKARLSAQLNKLSPQEVTVYLQQRKAKRQFDRQRLKKAFQFGQLILIDLVYEDKMNHKENRSLANQIELIVKGMKVFESPPAIQLCSFTGGIKQQFQKLRYEYLPLRVSSDDVLLVGKQYNKKLIYLSPDAQLPLETVDLDTAYILGGLIDRSIIKYASLKRAKQLNIEARHLPIRDYIKNRSCLNLDHVVLILCKFAEVKDWKLAFDFGAPNRWKKQQKDNISNEKISVYKTKEDKEDDEQYCKQSDESHEKIKQDQLLTIPHQKCS